MYFCLDEYLIVRDWFRLAYKFFNSFTNRLTMCLWQLTENLCIREEVIVNFSKSIRRCKGIFDVKGRKER